MKIETTGRELKDAMRLLSRVENKAVVPWSATLLHALGDGRAMAEACDGEQGVRVWFSPSTSNETGEVAVATRQLVEVAREVGLKDTVTLKTAEEDLVVSSGSQSWTIPTLEKELPDVLGVQMRLEGADAAHISLPCANLARLLGHVSYAISSEETRYYLKGVYLHIVDGRLKAIATDDHRMAVASVLPLLGPPEFNPGVIIPKGAVALLEKVLARAPKETDADIRIAGGRVSFAWHGFRLITKTVDGTFPEYERVIPKENGCTLSFEEGCITLEELKRVSAKARGNVAYFTLAEGTAPQVKIGTYGEKRAKNQWEDLSAHYTGKSLGVAFQPCYLRNLLDRLEGLPEFHFEDDRGPALIRDTGDPDVTHVLMPMRL